MFCPLGKNVCDSCISLSVNHDFSIWIPDYNRAKYILIVLIKYNYFAFIYATL